MQTDEFYRACGFLAIFLVYGIDVNVKDILAKGNFDQMIVEVEDLSKLSKVYVSTKDSQSYSTLFEGNAEHVASKLFSLPDNTLGKLVGSAIFFLVGFVSITRHLKKVEVIVSQGTTALQAAVANLLFHKPHVMFLHYFAYNELFLLNRKFLAALFRIVELFTIRHCNCVVAPNEELKAQALTCGANSVEIIPNFVETERIDRVDDRIILREKFHFDDLKVILFVGRLHRVKNVDFLLRSFSRMNALGNCILVIIGDGPEKQHLSDLAYSLGISKRVFFEGFKSKKVVFQYMKASDVLVLPSFVEGQPRVVLEAWAIGLLVVVSKRPGLENLVTDRVNGLLFDPKSEKRLEETIAFALDNKVANRIKSNAKKCVQKYSMERVLFNQRDLVMKFLRRDKNAQMLDFNSVEERAYTMRS
jgi:glycosyltransferase involved in cell wall biosynthesis